MFGTKASLCGTGTLWMLLSSFTLKQVDRSPTGSGVTARIALQYHKGLLELNQTRAFKSSATGSVFTGKAVRVSNTLSFLFVSVWLLKLKRPEFPVREGSSLSSQKKMLGAPGWLSRLSVHLRLRSWSRSSWLQAPYRGLCCQRGEPV